MIADMECTHPHTLIAASNQSIYFKVCATCLHYEKKVAATPSRLYSDRFLSAHKKRLVVSTIPFSIVDTLDEGKKRLRYGDKSLLLIRKKDGTVVPVVSSRLDHIYFWNPSRKTLYFIYKNAKHPKTWQIMDHTYKGVGPLGRLGLDSTTVQSRGIPEVAAVLKRLDPKNSYIFAKPLVHAWKKGKSLRHALGLSKSLFKFLMGDSRHQNVWEVLTHQASRPREWSIQLPNDLLLRCVEKSQKHTQAACLLSSMNTDGQAARLTTLSLNHSPEKLGIFRDTIVMMTQLGAVDFEALSPSTLDYTHTRLSREVRARELENLYAGLDKPFEYKPEQLTLEAPFMGIRLPRTPREIVERSAIMSNCTSGYISSIRSHSYLLLAMTTKEGTEVDIGVRLNSNEPEMGSSIEQFSTKQNKPLPQEIRKLVYEWASAKGVCFTDRSLDIMVPF